MADKKQTIVVCCSNLVDRKLVVDYLSDLGCEIVDFQEKDTALGDLYILDVPSARRVGQYVLTLKEATDVFLPVLVVLGKDDPVDPLLAAGFDDSLQVPFTKTHLMAKTAMLLRLREQSRELARKSESMYQTIFEATGTATIIVEENTTIIRANRECLQVTGYSPEELTGTKWTNYVTPESLEMMLKYHGARRDNPELTPSQYEVRLINKTGQVRYAILQVSMVPGTKQSVVSMVDITERKQAEEALRESESKYRDFVDHAAEGLCQTALLEGRLLSGNMTGALMFGYESPEEAIRTVTDIGLQLYANPADRQRAVGILMEKGFLKHFECQMRRKDGSTFWAFVNGRLIKTQDGTHVFQGFITDITNLKQAEVSLKESEAKYRSLFENSVEGIFQTTPEGRFISANPALANFFGYDSPQELMEEITDIGKQHYVNLRDRETFKNILETEGIIKGFEVQLVNKEGNPLWVSINARAVRDDKGSVIRYEGTLENITERKQAEIDRGRLVTAIEQTDDVIVITDPAGTVQHVNPAFETVTGYTPKEVLGQNPRILKSGKQDEVFYRNMWATILSGKTWKGRMVNKRKDGSLYTEEASISPVRDTKGSITSFVAVKRDITERLQLSNERARLEDQLRQSQKVEAIGQLAGGVAHDFNNMLSVILGYGESLLGQLHQGDPLREEVEQIVEAGRRSATLTRQLLAFSRKQPLQPRILNVNDILKALEAMVHRLIGENIVLQIILSNDLADTKVDPGQLEQVIMNIVINARDAMPQGGKLLIETANVELDEIYVKKHIGCVPGEYTMIAVTDTGSGMDAETVAKVFDPFFTTKEKEKGTGLGLSTVYGIIKQSGGNIWVYSEPGYGTTFKIYLPRTHEMPHVVEKQTVREKQRGKNEAILVVEDEAALRGLLETVLSSFGYRVTLAANGGEALLLVEEKGLKPDLVITDVVMPGMSGFILINRLKKSRGNLKVLYMSGYTDNAIVHHGMLDPGTPFIQKPFTVKDLAEKIDQVLHGE
jgi:PAS domain S-box-containing protein